MQLKKRQIVVKCNGIYSTFELVKGTIMTIYSLLTYNMCVMKQFPLASLTL